MLRMRRVGEQNRQKWTFNLQDADSQTHYTFRSLGALMLFIEQQTVEKEMVDTGDKMKK